MPKVVVYVRAEDARRLREKGAEPSAWVRELVRRALERRRVEELTSISERLR